MVLFEVAYGYFLKKQTYRPLDTIASLSSGLTNIIKDSLELVIMIVSHPFLLDNLDCTLRQSISNFFEYFVLLLIPAAFIGIPTEVIGLLLPIHLFAQFWYHTRHICKLGWLEYIIVTPLQHRVHHSINDIYIDKNLATISCLWDRAFGTFQEELEEVPPIFGVLKPAKTWNPILINVQHLWRLIKDI